MRDPYSVLGVKKNAGQEEIKAAWRSLAKAVHPDQNHDDPLATVRFTEAGRAYDLLRDPEKRSRYDRQQREAELRRMEQMRRQQAERKATASPPPRMSSEDAEDMIARIFGVDSRGQQTDARAQARPQAQAQPQAQPQPQTQTQTGTAAGQDARRAVEDPAAEETMPEREIFLEVFYFKQHAALFSFKHSSSPVHIRGSGLYDDHPLG